MTYYCIAAECKNGAPSWTTEARPSETLLCPEHWVALPYHPFRSHVRTILQRRARYADGQSDGRFWMEVAILRARIALYEKRWTDQRAAEHVRDTLLVVLPTLPYGYVFRLRQRFPSLRRLYPATFAKMKAPPPRAQRTT